jgi:acetyl esterase/lipase
MAFALDPQVAVALEPPATALERLPLPPVGDVATRRANAAKAFAYFASQLPPADDVSRADYATTARDGTPIDLRWFTKHGAASGPAVYCIHGGGMILGSLDLYDALLRDLTSASGVPTLAVEYRLAPEHSYPTPLQDCYAGLVWLADHAAELGVDLARIAIMGDSAGGGLAAATALMARDRGAPALARQILIYPMLDDRTTSPDPALVPFLTWTYDDNVTGWSALLGELHGGDDVPAFAAPARAFDVSGLPPTYLDVGELDIFRDEDIEYARRLAASGTPVELHVHPAVPHAFDAWARDADVSRRARADRIRILKSL